MIFVTTGTEYFPFERLICAIDEAKGKGIIKDDVIIQCRTGEDKIKNCRTHTLIKPKEISALIKKSDLYICHAGVGSILAGLDQGKIPLTVPRYKKFGEHIDDHQLDIANEFKRRNVIVACYEKDDIIEKINNFKVYMKDVEKYTPAPDKADFLSYLKRLLRY